MSTDPADTHTYVGALHLSNNTVELTAAVQVMLYFAALHEHADRDATSPRPPCQVLIVSDSTYTINAATKRQMPCGRDSPNVALISVLREVCQWVSGNGTTIDWLHVKGHARALGMVSKTGLKGNAGNEAADTCATHGQRGTQPRTTGSIRELMTLITWTRPGWVRVDEQMMTMDTPDAQVAAQKAAGIKTTTDDDDNAGGINESDAQADGDRERGRCSDASAEGFYTNMHRAISGAIWGRQRHTKTLVVVLTTPIETG